MSLSALNETEKSVLLRALQLMAGGRIIEEWEFSPRIGMELAEFRELLSRWPSWDDASDDSFECLAINNTLNDLLHGVGITEDKCLQNLGASKRELLALYDKW